MNAKEKLQAAIKKAGGLKTLRVGTRLYIFTEETRLQTLTLAETWAKRTGHRLFLDNNTSVVWEWTPVVNKNKEGSDRYLWDKTGNKIACVLLKTCWVGDEKYSSEIVDRAFKNYDEI